MMSIRSLRLPLAALLVVGLSACDGGTTELPSDLEAIDDADLLTEIVLTEGVAPTPWTPSAPSFRVANATFGETEISLVGSETGEIQLTPNSCDTGSMVEIEASFSVEGRLRDEAAFTVPTTYTYAGSGDWVASGESETLTVGAQGPNDTSAGLEPVTITLINDSEELEGNSSFDIEPTVTESGGDGKGNSLNEGAAASVEVEFIACDDDDRKAPWLGVPKSITREATSGYGAEVAYKVWAWDRVDGKLTSEVECTIDDGATVVDRTGHQFPFKETEVTCSVTNSANLTTEKTFSVYVEDTTAPELATNWTKNDSTLIAEDASGLVLRDAETLFGLEAKDYAPEDVRLDANPEVSTPVDIACDVTHVNNNKLDEPADVDDYSLRIGETAMVSCTATDDSEGEAPEYTSGPNTSDAATFTVTVGLDLTAACGFKAPLRMEYPFSAHKANSTIPHKLCAPSYADGSLATDLADLLRLELVHEGDFESENPEIIEDPATGSTEWRWDPEDEHYIFNAKTSKTWHAGLWSTTVSIGNVDLAQTFFNLR